MTVRLGIRLVVEACSLQCFYEIYDQRTGLGLLRCPTYQGARALAHGMLA